MGCQLPQVSLIEGPELDVRLDAVNQLLVASQTSSLTRDPRWLLIFRDAMKHRVFLLTATIQQEIVGFLPLVLMKSWLFGNRLVSLPYVNTAGVLTRIPELQQLLVQQAMELADRLRVKSLELRNEELVDVTDLTQPATQKVHMRLSLPAETETLWKAFNPKVRNQIRKAEKNELTVRWGALEELPAFYQVFSTNMRDLGTPVFSRKMFSRILSTFPDAAELCTVYKGMNPVASGLLLHGHGVTEVPSASSLREYNSTCANMLMYWNMLKRAVERKQRVFDFGRSSPDSPTYQFKKQWGAQAEAAAWQYYLRGGSTSDLRPDNPRFRLLINTWKKLPLWLTRWIGPPIARVIP
ncbi:MAG: FemAB family PEP-CTERM system-associated protein [Planctomycetia bacterium]|nr:FemAB family PEP-CTERM system-associated protein [Planctomycetia bacterium]